MLRSAAAQAIFISDVPKVFELNRDLDDEVFVNLAVAAKADYLVSRDQDLLDLRDNSEFTSQFPNLKIVNPVGFLKLIRAT